MASEYVVEHKQKSFDSCHFLLLTQSQFAVGLAKIKRVGFNVVEVSRFAGPIHTCAVPKLPKELVMQTGSNML